MRPTQTFFRATAAFETLASKTMKPLAVILAGCLFLTSGCGFLTASIDVDAAIALAARENLENFRVAARDKASVHDAVSAKLEAALDNRIVVAKDGIAALALLKDYRVKRAELTGRKTADMAIYAKALDNASLIVQLIDQRLALRARWDALAGRVPAISQLRAIAEAESAAYVNALTPK